MDSTQKHDTTLCDVPDKQVKLSSNNFVQHYYFTFIAIYTFLLPYLHIYNIFNMFKIAAELHIVLNL